MTTETKPKYIEADGTDLTGSFPVTFELEGFALGKRRNEVKVGMTEPAVLKTWDLASDEGKFHGGDETAPKPLALFTAGVVTCFMTQVRTFARKCDVKVQGLSVKAHFEWVARRSGQDPYTAHPVKFVIDIDLDTPSPLENQKALIRAASGGCFAEQIMSVEIEHRLRHDGGWVLAPVD